MRLWHKAFTMIELIFVIVVISILVALFSGNMSNETKVTVNGEPLEFEEMFKELQETFEEETGIKVRIKTDGRQRKDTTNKDTTEWN